MSMVKQISLQVNGKKQTLEVDPDTPLLYVLRDHFNLNGPKYGCGMSQCGSCMVLIGENAVTSCQLPVNNVKDKPITTIEGLADPGGGLHPVQEAFVNEQAAQCGYCMNGMLISAVALLSRNAHPDRQTIKEGMQRNLCRCGTYTRFIRAIQTASGKL